MAAPLTKDQEIETYARIIASVPRNSYLADFLADSLDQFANNVRNDMAFPTLAQHRRDVAELHHETAAQLKAAREQLNKLRDEIATLERRAARAKQDLDDIRRAARTLATA